MWWTMSGYRTTSFSSFEASHFIVFKDLLTYILFTLRSTIRAFDTYLKIYRFSSKPFAPVSSLKWSCSRVLLLTRWEPLQGTGLQEGVTQSIWQSNWHNQRLHKSYQHSQAPRRLLRWQFHGSPPECNLPISREWQTPESRYSALSHG